MCRNWKVWALIAAVTLGIVAFTPVTLGALLPLLVFAACPLMMVLGGGIVLRGTQSATRHRDTITERDRELTEANR